MTESVDSPVSGTNSDLRAEFAACEAMLDATAPVLRHLLALGENLLLSEEIIARVRGMFSDIGRQLFHALAQAAGNEVAVAYENGQSDELLPSLLNHPGLLRHVHALAIEAQLAETLRIRSGLDPVLAPMLQNLISSPDPRTSASAMAVLAAQARFVQRQRRMELPLGELPADLHEAALSELRKHASAEGDAIIDDAIAGLRGRFEADDNRLSLLSRLIAALDSGPASVLSVEQAGIALFVTALAAGSDQSRDTAVLATDVTQYMRLALMLRMSGLSPQAVATQLLTLHPGTALPVWFADLSAERATALLTATISGGLD